MAIKILLDECIPMAVYDYLKGRNFDVVHVKRTSWSGLGNSELYLKAQGNYQILITTDRHFANPEKFQPTADFGVVYLRVAPTVGPLLIKALERFLKEADFESVIGKLVVVRRENFAIC